MSTRLFAFILLLFATVASAEDTQRRVVALVPLGKVEPALLQAVSEAIRERIDVDIRLEPQRPLPAKAFYSPRRRWRAEKILEALDAEPPPGAWRIVGVTEAEISTTKGDIKDWGIAGLGSLTGPSCVLSSHIYRKHSRTREVLLRRFADLAAHEFGHTLGLDHCETERCVMADAKGKAVSSADNSSGHFCPRCLGLLTPDIRAMVKQPAAPK